MQKWIYIQYNMTKNLFDDDYEIRLYNSYYKPAMYYYDTITRKFGIYRLKTLYLKYRVNKYFSEVYTHQIMDVVLH